ncbi:VWA domain-containing protein [uncultured Paludibaculum sp.]|uniref:VWA domain-containing protein n=1 Tax=uncultured Paludibaculum sp. TaxID=1765020 RepID=UPI002AABF132|nr:VWA domain-containing protein [uncultured Paludibaculum sp.]
MKQRLWAVVLISAALAPSLRAQAPAFRSESTDVLVDVVVRDKHGRLIRGLTRSDLVVKEDGEEQTITSFRAVSASPGAATARPAEAEQSRVAAVRQERVQVSTQKRLVSLVYDRLGPDGRRLGRQASLDFLKKDLGPNVYYAVFTIDRGFKVVQPYTDDMARLKKAVEAATSGERSDFQSDLANMSRTANAAGNADGAESPTPSQGTVDGAAMSAAQAGQMAKEMLDFSEVLEREDLGRMSVFSLWAIVKELRKLPGRKTVLYFAEGLQMPNSMVEQFKSMLSEANRANVTVYAIDARGLTTVSDQGAANAKLSEAAQWSRYARNTQNETAAGNKQEFRTFDRAADSLRANQQNEMLELAESTGGFLIANTNDLRPNLEKLSEEFNTYYEITYHPKNQVYDGRFRAIAVSVTSRKDAVVQARDGYFALPVMEGQTVFSYEAPLLRVLSRNPLPRELEFRAGVVQFRQRMGLQQAALVFDLPLKNVAFAKDEKVGKYRTHITVLALVKDADGRVVSKLSRDVPLNEPMDRLEGFQQGRFIVTRAINLAPGRYTVESVAADQEGQRVSAKKSVLVVMRHTGEASVSDITLVRRIDKPAEERDPQDALQVPVGRIVPTLIDSVPGGSGKLLSLFFTLYPDETSQDPPKVVLDLLRDGQVVSRTSPALPPAGPDGSIPYVANIPLDSVAAAQYQFRATLVQGNFGAQKSIYLNIE